MRRIHKVTRAIIVISAAAVSIAVASPASAAPLSVTATVGPVGVPNVPVTVCIDTTCVATPPLNQLSLTATATADVAVAGLTIEPTSCPNGGTGAAVEVSSMAATTVTITAAVHATGPTGTVNASVGPLAAVLSPSLPGVLVSACTT